MSTHHTYTEALNKYHFKRGWIDGWLEDHPGKTLADAEKAFLTQHETKEAKT